MFTFHNYFLTAVRLIIIRNKVLYNLLVTYVVKYFTFIFASQYLSHKLFRFAL